MRLITIGAGIGAVALALTGCTGDNGGDGQTVDGATFTMALNADPGALDPQVNASSNLYAMTQLAYDFLLSMNTEGEIGSALASEWEVDGTTVTLTLHDDVTCSDGTPFTAEDVVANLDWILDPENASPALGTFIPVGATVSAPDATTVTIELAEPAPFVLNGLANLPVVCGSAVEDRDQLATTTLGTGPYVLTESAPNDSYTYELRDDWTWGPDGVTSETPGLPAKVVVRIIPNETTAANLLLSGELNAAAVLGADADRLRSANLFSIDSPSLVGEMWFNQTEGLPGADENVRLAFTQALDLGDVANVLTEGKGGPATSLAVSPPVACPGDSVSAALPKFDLEAAATLLDEAGWVAGADGKRAKDGAPLTVTFIYDTGSGSGGVAAGELAAQSWTELGAEVEVKPQDESTLVSTIFVSGDWDIAWVPLNVSSPDQLISFTSGTPAPDGSNFAHIDNEEYLAKVADASKLPGLESCDAWHAAEAELVKAADVVPFANQPSQVFGSGATFETSGSIRPSTIRMLAQ
jgi:peptide/nickel transport system substrate-binding protein